MIDLSTRLGPVTLESPLVGASGTVGSGWELASAADLAPYGALVAKSVSWDPWPGLPPPRLAPAGVGMLNGIGIQNPGIERWVADALPKARSLSRPVWGSAVGRTPTEYANVARSMEVAGVPVVELNLSCPNLEDGRMFALDPDASRQVVREVRNAVRLPLGAKLSPNAEDVAEVAEACAEAGADWVVLTNTAWGGALDPERGASSLSRAVGGYSGPPLKPLALRCVLEVRRRLPDLPILGCGGVVSGDDVVEYLRAGASAVALGTIHFAEPRAGRRILSELRRRLGRLGATGLVEIIGGTEEGKR